MYLPLIQLSRELALLKGKFLLLGVFHFFFFSLTVAVAGPQPTPTPTPTSTPPCDPGYCGQNWNFETFSQLSYEPLPFPTSTIGHEGCTLPPEAEAFELAEDTYVEALTDYNYFAGEGNQVIYDVEDSVKNQCFIDEYLVFDPDAYDDYYFPGASNIVYAAGFLLPIDPATLGQDLADFKRVLARLKRSKTICKDARANIKLICAMPESSLKDQLLELEKRNLREQAKNIKYFVGELAEIITKATVGKKVKMAEKAWNSSKAAAIHFCRKHFNF